jgi:hypothetical protein
MGTEPDAYPQGKHRYPSVIDGVALANNFARSGLQMNEFGCSRSARASIVHGDDTAAKRVR